MKKFISIAMTVALAMSLVPATAFAEDAKTTAKAIDVAVIGDDDKVVLSVEAGKDVPVFYSGVDVKNTGITDNAKHVSLKVTAEEASIGAWSMEEAFTFTLPEGVYAVGDNGVRVTEATGFMQGSTAEVANAWTTAFKAAYANGGYKSFAFNEKAFDGAEATDNGGRGKLTFTMTLVAEPWFEGDVILGLEGASIEPQEVVIATFVKPYTVEAEVTVHPNDCRCTPVLQPIVITEADGGLLAEDAAFQFFMDKEGLMEFEDDGSYDASDSKMKLKAHPTNDGGVAFAIESKSGKAATITISDVDFYADQRVPVGPYDLLIGSSLYDSFRNQILFGHTKAIGGEMELGETTVAQEGYMTFTSLGGDRDMSDFDFTKKVVVPVGKSHLTSNEEEITLDFPAYITETGYTMLPVRAVAKAIGVSNNSVLWNNEAKTVTIFMGQRIITMTVAAEVVNVNGSAIPSSAAVEITNGRVFLPMRDLANALGVTDIEWDADTKTATLNGSGDK